MTSPGCSTSAPMECGHPDHVLGNVMSSHALAGRYEPLRRLGAGSMGEVWAAFDRRLEREVAIKQLIPCDATTAHLHVGRLRREAAALARVSDPHVVQIFDVGSHHHERAPPEESSEHVFIVMQLVEGVPLSRWLARRRRTLDEILAVFDAAGRGLAAAHTAGLVHRDFKPSNVLVAEDRREREQPGGVRVCDFGLARAVEGSHDPDATVAGGSRQDATEIPPTLIESLTATGMVLGTPLYMAPEQHEGRSLGPACDQYAFCVALWEALFDARAFDGSIARIIARKHSRSPARPANAMVPAAIERVLLRGLAPDPTERWPDMFGLLGALGRARRPVRWRRWIAGGACILGLAGAAAPTRETPAPCPSLPLPTWSAVELEGLGAHDRAAVLVDEYRDALERAHATACEAPPGRRAASLPCLRDAAEQLDAVVELCAGSPPEATDLPALFDGLPDLQQCMDADASASGLVTQVREPVVAELAELARAEVLWRGGHDHEALRIGESILRAIEHGDAPPVPLRARARLLIGKTLHHLGSYDRGDASVAEAYFEAAANDDADTAFDAAVTEIIELAGRTRAVSAESWLRHATAEFERLRPSALRFARLAYARGSVAEARHDLELAAAEYQLGLSVCPPGACSAGVGLASARAEVLRRQGSYGDAEVLEHTALEATSARFGERSLATLGHRFVLLELAIDQSRIDEATRALTSIDSLLREWNVTEHFYRANVAFARARISYERHDLPEAIAELERAVRIGDATLTAADAHRLPPYIALGYAYFDSERPADALATFTTADEIARMIDPAAPQRGALLVMAGHVRAALGDPTAGLADIRQGIAIVDATYGARHPWSLQGRTNEAAVLRSTGQWADALDVLETVAVDAEGLEPTHPTRAGTAIGIAICRIELGDSAGALAELDRADVAGVAEPAQRHWIAFHRARVLVHDDPELARALAVSARHGLRSLGTDATLIDDWLSTRSARRRQR